MSLRQPTNGIDRNVSAISWLALLTSWSGRIGLRTFVRAVLLILVLNFAAFGLASLLGEQVGVLGPLATAWFSLTICAKRLRAVGLSPWLQVPQRIATATALILLLLQIWFPNHAVIMLSAAPLLAIGLLADLVLTIWLCAARETPWAAEAFD